MFGSRLVPRAGHMDINKVAGVPGETSETLGDNYLSTSCQKRSIPATGVAPECNEHLAGETASARLLKVSALRALTARRCRRADAARCGGYRRPRITTNSAREETSRGWSSRRILPVC